MLEIAAELGLRAEVWDMPELGITWWQFTTADGITFYLRAGASFEAVRERLAEKLEEFGAGRPAEIKLFAAPRRETRCNKSEAGLSAGYFIDGRLASPTR